MSGGQTESTTVLCESCGIHQRMRHRRRCDLCNATKGEVQNDGERVTIETVGRERFCNDVVANAAVMAGLRMGLLIRFLLDERANLQEQVVQMRARDGVPLIILRAQVAASDVAAGCKIAASSPGLTGATLSGQVRP